MDHRTNGHFSIQNFSAVPYSKGKGATRLKTMSFSNALSRGACITCHALLSDTTSFSVPSHAPYLGETKSSLVFLLRDELSWHKMKPFV